MSARPPHGPTLSQMRAKLAWPVLVLALIAAAIAWFSRTFLSIRSDTGAPVGSSVRTRDHVATLVRALEPYVPSLHRDPANDRYRAGVFLAPLAGGAAPRLVPIVSAQPIAALQLARLLGDDGRTLWFDVAGLGGVDLDTFEPVTVADLRRANPALDPDWWQDARGASVDGRLRLVARDRSAAIEIDPRTRRASSIAPSAVPSRPPFPPKADAFLAAGVCTSETAWLGVLTDAEAERDFRPGSWLRRVTRAGDQKATRRLWRGTLGPASAPDRWTLESRAALGDVELPGGAFVCADGAGAPLLLDEPAGVLVASSSSPGLRATLVVSRVDLGGAELWRVDTGIDRFLLQQILPGVACTAFVGTRPAVPDKVSEPILVVVDHGTGAMRVHSSWQ